MKHQNKQSQNNSRERIHYAQCWEDPLVLLDGLQVEPSDDVLSIASGGDNTFALLLQNPRSLYAIDRNLTQIFLVELKIKALQKLEYDDFVKFLGARPDGRRERLYRHLRPILSDGARGYWDYHHKELQAGVIHSGKFEQCFRLFRRYVLPLIHKQVTVSQLFTARSSDQQQQFYDKVWNNRRWRALFRIFFGKFLLESVGRDPATFRYVDIACVADELLKRTQHGFTDVSTNNNCFLEYILTGVYRNLEHSHPYLRESNFRFLKANVAKIQLVHSGLEEFLAELSPQSISKVNASDVFEYMSRTEFEQVLRAILGVSRGGATVAFWTLFVPREIPESLRGHISLVQQEPCLRSRINRTFFYDSFCVWKVGVTEEQIDITDKTTEAPRWEYTA